MKRLLGIGLSLIILSLGLSAWGASIENALALCNQGIKERNNVLWAECNDITVEAAKQSWLDIEQQLRDLAKEKYDGKLVGYNFGEFKILAVNDEGHALVKHRLSFRYLRHGEVYEFTWEALNDTFLKDSTSGVWFQSIDVRSIGPIVVERGL